MDRKFGGRARAPERISPAPLASRMKNQLKEEPIE
jgi:hypothetical protein